MAEFASLRMGFRASKSAQRAGDLKILIGRAIEASNREIAQTGQAFLVAEMNRPGSFARALNGWARTGRMAQVAADPGMVLSLRTKFGVGNIELLDALVRHNGVPYWRIVEYGSAEAAPRWPTEITGAWFGPGGGRVAGRPFDRLFHESGGRTKGLLRRNTLRSPFGGFGATDAHRYHVSPVLPHLFFQRMDTYLEPLIPEIYDRNFEALLGPGAFKKAYGARFPSGAAPFNF